MLKNVLEDYLTSITEIQFFIPFRILLESSGYYDVHLVHGSIEFGKDFIAKKMAGEEECQYVFQLKAGNIDLAKYRKEIQPQLLDACTNTLAHPNYRKDLTRQVLLVCTGQLNNYASIALQEFNENTVIKRLHLPAILVWEKELLKEKLNNTGLDKYFEFHNSTSLLAGFFTMFSKIQNEEEISALEVSQYTDSWFSLSWEIPNNKLQIFLETFLFSKQLIKQRRYIESFYFVASLARILIKVNEFSVYEEQLSEYCENIFNEFCDYVNSKRKNESIFSLRKKGVFLIFYYPESCLKTAEILSLSILISSKIQPKQNELLIEFIQKEKGVFRPLSENYTISFILISLALFKIERVDLLKIYLVNTTIWLCDRHQEHGLAPIGSTLQEEYEHLISEQLNGLEYKQNNASFLASAILDIAYLVGDKELFSNISNDLKATNIILEFFHVLNDEDILTHNSNNILTSADVDYSDELVQDYSKYIILERKRNQVKQRGKELFFVMYLLRDRYFPTFMKELIKCT